MKPLLFIALFIVGAAVGMAIVPLLPNPIQKGISSLHLEIEYQVGIEERPGEMANSSAPTPNTSVRDSPLTTYTPTPSPSPRIGISPLATATPTPPPFPRAIAVTLPAPTPTTAHTPTPTPPPTPTPSPTPVPPPDQRHYRYKVYMLELINKERVEAGVQPVTLGDNFAAQLHAENSLANCFSSHWGLDGLKPYMRYSLAGGYQSNGENWYGSDYCIRASDRYSGLG